MFYNHSKNIVGQLRELSQCQRQRLWIPLPPKSMLQKQGKRKNQKLHMFWQPATLIKRGKGICPTIFLTDCLKTKAN